MGTTQLILITVGAIIVGVSVAVGISTFNGNAKQQNRDAIQLDLLRMASSAQKYYRTPVQLGGGGNSFDGIDLSNIGFEAFDGAYDNPNATYTIASTATDELNIVGESAVDDELVLEITVRPDDFNLTDGLRSDDEDIEDEQLTKKEKKAAEKKKKQEEKAKARAERKAKREQAKKERQEKREQAQKEKEAKKNAK